jgi:hypothetical protein
MSNAEPSDVATGVPGTMPAVTLPAEPAPERHGRTVVGAYAAAVDHWVPCGRRRVATWLGRRFARPAAALDGWWASRSPRERAGIKVLLLGLTVVVLIVNRPVSAPRETTPRVSMPSGRTEPEVPPASQGITDRTEPPAGAARGTSVPSVPAVVPTGTLDEAKAAAAVFATAFGSWRYDDPPGALVERVRPLATEALLAELSSNHSSGAAFRQRMVADQTVATAVVDTVQTQRSAPGDVDLVVVARQEVRSAAGTETRHPAYLLRMVWTDGGWRVAEFMP